MSLAPLYTIGAVWLERFRQRRAWDFDFRFRPCISRFYSVRTRSSNSGYCAALTLVPEIGDFICLAEAG